jgi:hypothetical protein
MKKHLLHLFYAGWLLLIIGYMQCAIAAESTIFIRDFNFVPNEITITEGQIVTWMNADDEKSYQISSQDGFITSNTIIPGENFSLAFKLPGEYTFFCKNFPYMIGKVKVLPLNSYIHGEVKTEVNKVFKNPAIPAEGH